HRKTMLAAYDELLAQGWIEMIPRKGTFVVQHLPEIKPVKIKPDALVTQYPEKTNFAIDEKNMILFPIRSPQLAAGSLVLNDGFPDVREAPTELFIRELRSMARRSAFKKYYGYGGPQGTNYLRETLSTFLSDTRGLAISPDNIMITQGAQMAIYLASRLLIKPGSHVVVGEPSYFAATLTFQEAGAAINRVPVDEQGMNIDAVELLCKKKKIGLVYVIPHHHHPTTVTLTPERRIRLLELAAQYKFAIIEDDYDYDFHYNSSPVLPMASLDHQGTVVYIGTLSKTLMPAIRIGFLVAPKNFINAVAHLRRPVDWQGDSLMEIALAELYKNGTIGRHIKKVVKLYRERRDHFCALLADNLGDKVTFRVPDGGMSVWTKFNTRELKKISGQAALKGLVMSDGLLYNTHTTNYNSARLGFASLNLKEQKTVIEILKASV
ncbi:MAG: PLP-dependent aminotransferase family protein, partial [Bacteroidota bacterium]